jgi:hypothetical protein
MLLDELRRDYDPVGLLEHSSIRVIATLLWRKSRLGIFAIAEAARRKYGEDFADGDFAVGAATVLFRKEEHDLKRMATVLECEQTLKPKIMDQLAEVDDVLARVEKTMTEMGITEADRAASRAAAAEKVEKESAENVIEMQLAYWGDRVSADCFSQQLELLEQIDAAIERALDRLIKYQTKRIYGSGFDRRRSRRHGVRS